MAGALSHPGVRRRADQISVDDGGSGPDNDARCRGGAGDPDVTVGKIGRNDPCPCGSGRSIEGPHEHPDAEGPRQDEGEEEGVPDAIAAGLIGAHYERRERLAGRPAYDFDWMWPDLGLGRPS
jgi:hypothetical protein